MIVILIIHAAIGQGLDTPTLADVEVSVLVPADDVKEKAAHESSGRRRELVRAERQRQFVSAVEQRKRIVAFLDQLVHLAVARAPSGRRATPRSGGAESGVVRRERQRVGKVLEFTEPTPTQICAVCRELNLIVLRGGNFLAECGGIPMDLEGGCEPETEVGGLLMVDC